MDDKENARSPRTSSYHDVPEFDDESFSSSSYASSQSDDDIPLSPRSHDGKSTYKQRRPLTKSVIAAQATQKRREEIKKEMLAMLRERSQLTKNIQELESRIDTAAPTTESTRKRMTVGGADDLKKDALPTASNSDTTGEPPHKRPKLSEPGENAHAAPKLAGAAKRAMQNPLMQRLLVGTLQKSQKEVDAFKHDKSVRTILPTAIARLDRERAAKKKRPENKHFFQSLQICLFAVPFKGKSLTIVFCCIFPLEMTDDSEGGRGEEGGRKVGGSSERRAQEGGSCC